MELYELAQEAFDWFTTTKRHDDTEIVVTKDGRPDWVLDIVHAAHDGAMLPDDWTYEVVWDMLGAIADGEMTDEDDVDEYICGGSVQPEVYTAPLLNWARDNYSLVDEYVEECGWPGSLVNAAQGAQAERKGCILRDVFSKLEELLEDFDDKGDEEDE